MSYTMSRNERAKILILGDSGVGKTSLINLICNSNILTSTQWTIGCSIEVKLFQDHFLEFWDIGGSRGHKIARPFLYQDHHGIILVFDATNKKSKANLIEWLTEVGQKYSGKVPIITIATKKDQLPPDSFLENDVNNETSKHIRVELNNSTTSSISATPTTPTTPTLTFRKQLATNTSSIVETLPSSSFYSSMSSLLNLSSPLQQTTNIDQLLSESEKQIVYVDTQNELSFNVQANVKNYTKLENFFKNVILRRRNKFEL